jgi:hypothetical protein
MRTPDGRECPHYYVDVHRWHEGRAECRLLEGTPDAERWQPTLCRACPVPEIRRANACERMVLHARVARRVLQFWKGPQVKVTATCTRSRGPVDDPYRGCGYCHDTFTFVVAEERS